MAATVKIELNKGGVRELLTSPGAQAVVMGYAQAIAARAGEGHDVMNATTNRARAIVMTKSVEAVLAEARDRNLTRAFGAGT